MKYRDLCEFVMETEGDVESVVSAVRLEFPSVDFVGHGVNRVVFQFDSTSVVKLPIDESDMMYNQMELYNYISLVETRFESWVAPINRSFSAEDGSFIVMDVVDISVNCEQEVVANLSQAFEVVENGLDNFGRHSALGSVAVDYTECIAEQYRCRDYPV